MSITMDRDTMILIGVAAYFTIGAVHACGVAMLSYGFTGKGDKIIPILFFAWPVLWILKTPGGVTVLLGGGAVAAMVGVAWLILKLL